VKSVDYFREVYKGSSVLSLKDFLIGQSRNFDFKNIEFLLPTLFSNVSQPKLDVPARPQTSASPTSSR
jgi:hypothetical protein